MIVQNSCPSWLLQSPSVLRATQVDVRGCEEQAVSMIPGAVTKEFFEAEVLPQLRAQRAQTFEAAPLVVPYCTVAGF